MLSIIMIIIITICLDQMVKKYARDNFKGKKIRKGPLTFGLVKNKGAFRGLLKSKPTLLLIIQTIGVLLVTVMAVTIGYRQKDKLLRLGLALIAGGAIGNLIDRIREGEVTDFVAIKWTKNLYYNIADFAIFIGAIITVLRGDKL